MMRKFVIILASILISSSILAQDFKTVKDAFSEGNATSLGKMLDATVELTQDGKTSNMGKGDVENQMRSFFIDNEVKAYETVHKGVSQSDVHYLIGQLVTSKGGYRLTIYLHKSYDDYLIQSIEIEKD